MGLDIWSGVIILTQTVETVHISVSILTVLSGVFYMGEFFTWG